MTKSGKESTRRSRRLQLQDIKIVEDNKEEKEDEEDEEDEEDDDLIIDPTKLVIAVFPDKRKRKTVSKRSTIQKSSTCSKRNIQRGKSTQKEQIYPILPKGIKEVDPYHSEDEIVLSDHNHNDVTTTTVGLGFPTSLRTLKKDTIRFKKLFPGREKRKKAQNFLMIFL